MAPLHARLSPPSSPAVFWAQKKPLTAVAIRGLKFRQRATLPRANPAVPSPMRLFTSVFGMGTGVASSLWPPEKQSNVSGWTHRIERCFKLQYEVITASLWAISIGQLNVLQRLHLQPIKVVVFNLPSPLSWGKSCLRGGLALRCFQRLSVPHIATRHLPLA